MWSEEWKDKIRNFTTILLNLRKFIAFHSFCETISFQQIKTKVVIKKKKKKTHKYQASPQTETTNQTQQKENTELESRTRSATRKARTEHLKLMLN